MYACVPAGKHETVAWVGEERHARVRNKRRRGARLEHRQQFGDASVFIMVVKADEATGRHPALLEEQPCATRILGKDDIHCRKDFACAGRQVTRVAKRCRHHPEFR